MIRFGFRMWLAVLSAATLTLFGVACDCGDDDDNGGDDDAADDDAADDDVSDDDVTDDDIDDDDAADDDTADDDTADDDVADDDTVVVDIDFEDYALGPLGSPWDVIIYGASTATIIDDPTKAGSGRMLEINGSTTLTESVEAALDIDPQTVDFTVSFDFYYQTGAIFFFDFYGGEPPVSGPFHLLLVDNELSASPNPSPDPCATLTAGTWVHLETVVQPGAKKFSVLIDGTPSAACADLDFNPSFEETISRFSFMDVGNDGGGGIVYFDNVFLGWVM